MRQPKRKVRLSPLAGVVLLAFVSSSVRTDADDAGHAIWVGQSGGFIVRWSTSDITTQPAGNMEEVWFSARSLAQKDLDDRLVETRETYGEENRLVVYERDFTVLSVVGPFVSFRDHYFASLEREAHPAGETRYTTIDSTKGAKVGDKGVTGASTIGLAGRGDVVELTDLFSESDTLKALLADPLVGKALRDSGTPAPNTLAELIEQFSTAPMVEGECYSVSDDLLTQFAFHHMEQGKVAVRLGLSGAGPCRELITELGILLPIPEPLARPLALAESRREGFLMKDQEGIARDQNTTFEFTTGDDADR